MDLDNRRICIKCMRAKPDEGRCPHCGFDESAYVCAPHQLPPKTILHGKYLVGCVLGEGGFGITYMGWDLTLDMVVAIKEFFPTGFVTRDSINSNTITAYAGESLHFFERGREAFLSEAKTLARFFSEPGIVTVKEYFQENNTAYIVMEYIQGMHFAAFAEQCGGRVPVQQVLDMMRLPIDSLSVVHRTGLMHRDISPENLMVTDSGYVKLIDFGAARDIPAGSVALQKSLSVMLRPGYAPEEQYRTRGNQGEWTDVYGLCASMYRLITGEKPPEALDRVRDDPLVSPSRMGIKISPQVERALLKGLAVFAEDRYQSVEALRADLYREAPAPDPKYKSTPKPRTNPAPRLQKPVLLGVAGLLVVVLAVLGVLLLNGTLLGQKDGPVTFADQGFETLLREALGRPEGDILQSELADIDTLLITPHEMRFAWGETVWDGEVPLGVVPDAYAVRSLADVAHFPALAELYVTRHPVSDIGGVRELASLQTLRLYDTDVTDLSPLAGCASLERLLLQWNGELADLSPLAGLTGLTYLDVEYCDVQDVAPLKGLTGLTHLALAANRIEDVTPLAALTGLTYLTLGGNEGIGDIGALSGLHSLQTLKAGRIGIDSVAALAGMPQLRWAILRSNAIADLTPLGGLENLEILDLWHNQVTDLTPLAGLSSLREVNLEGNEGIGDWSPVGHVAQVAGRSEDEAVAFVDAAFEALLREALGRPEGEIMRSELAEIDTLLITPGGMSLQWGEVEKEGYTNAGGGQEGAQVRAVADSANFPALRSLYIVGHPIEDLSGVEDLQSLEYLRVDYSMLADIEPLRACAGLQWLILNDANVQTLSPLAELTGLTYLSLAGNGITDIDPLASLTGLETLDLRKNGITDISALAGMTALTRLALSDNRVTSIGPLAALVNLQSLTLYSNQIVSLQPVSGMAQLRVLNAWQNKIEDLSPLAGLTALEELNLNFNSVTDLSPLSAQSPDLVLYLNYNPNLTDWSPVAHIHTVHGRPEGWDATAPPATATADPPTQAPTPGAQATDAPAQTEALVFEDAAFERQLRAALDRPDGDITPADLATCETLLVTESGIFLEWGDLEWDATVYSATVADPVSSLADVAKFLALRELYVANHPITSLDGVQALSRLEFLRVDSAQVTDLSPLETLPGLRMLNLNNNEGLSALSPLEGLTRLTYLSMENCAVSDLTALAGLVNLQSLYLSDNDITSVEALAGLNLYTLYLSGNRIGDLTGLEGMIRLESLRLSHNEITDISPLSGCRGIQHLYLGNNRIDNIDALQRMSILVYLNLSYNEVSDLSPLVGKKRMQTLDLRSNQVVNLEPLAELTSLQTLYLGNNPDITDWSPVAHLDFVMGRP